MNVIDQYVAGNRALYNADCVEFMRDMIPSNSVGYSIFSPPYSTLYVYSNSDRDVGNCRSDEEFFSHFHYVIEGLMRVMMPGRNVSVDVMNLTTSKSRDGYIGLKDFRGQVISAFIAAGFIYHSEHVVWKDPLLAAVRTKALGLLHKQLCKDSTMSRAGLPQYLLTFRKPGENQQPVAHEQRMNLRTATYPINGGDVTHRRYGWTFAPTEPCNTAAEEKMMMNATSARWLWT